MKKPLLFSLLVWLFLLLLPWTRPQTLLDWKSGTTSQLSDLNGAWMPLDPPDRLQYSLTGRYTAGNSDDSGVWEDVKAGGLTVPPQFASLARTSTDRNVLFWCARSASSDKAVADNLVALNRRFPHDASVLAWQCAASIKPLRLMTRRPGPFTSYSYAWSVSSSNSGVYAFTLDPKVRLQWQEIAALARQGQKLEPHNAFWWWLEATSLLGARQDDKVWSVVHVGSTKSFYDDHNSDALLALRRAHGQTLGKVPVSAYLSPPSPPYWPWFQATQQFCENVLAARFINQHKKALEGAHDMLVMGRLLRLSRPSAVTGLFSRSTEEYLVLRSRSALPPSVTTARLVIGSSIQAFASHPCSLLRYANEQQRPDLARQFANEWTALSAVRLAQRAKSKTIGAIAWLFAPTGASDSLVALTGGTQNTGTLLVQTLPIPVLSLGTLSLALFALRRHPNTNLLPAPSWKRGLGWSAFALVVLIGAQTLFNYLSWSYFSFLVKPFWGLDFLLPRLVELLPVWAFAFPACVLGVGALWSAVFAARWTRGDASIWRRLRLLVSAPDDRVGVVNLEPLMQIIGIVSLWGIGLIALAAWFFLPQQGARPGQITNDLHSQFAGVMLAVFCALSVAPAIFLRTGHTGFRTYFSVWARTMRHFLVAHIALTTTLYLVLAIAGAFYSAQFDAQWLKTNAPSSIPSR